VLSLILGFAFLRAKTPNTADFLQHWFPTHGTELSLHRIRRNQVTVSYFRQTKFSAIVNDLLYRKTRFLSDFCTLHTCQPLIPHFFTLCGIGRAFYQAVQTNSMLYHITLYCQRFHPMHSFPDWHRHGCNISVPDHTDAGRKTPCHTPDRLSTALFSNFPVSGGCCSIVTGILESKTSVVCLCGLV
jgi:hypothetical protein